MASSESPFFVFLMMLRCNQANCSRVLCLGYPLFVGACHPDNPLTQLSALLALPSLLKTMLLFISH